MLSREWNGGDLRILFGALVLAVAMVTSIGLFAQRLERSIAVNSSRMLGADLVIEAPRPIEDAVLPRAGDELLVSHSVSFASMASHGEKFTLTSVRAIDHLWPLRGKVELADAPFGRPSAASGIEPGEVWADGRVLQALGITVGDSVEIGDKTLTITKILVSYPGGAGASFAYGPPILMHLQDVVAANVVQPGSRVTYCAYLSGSEDKIAAYRKRIEAQLFPEHRVYGVKEGRPRVANAIERAQRYLLMACALGVALAGASVAVASRRYSVRNIQVVAVMKTLGCTSQQINRLYLQQFIILVTLALLTGWAMGWGLQALIVSIVGELFKMKLAPADFQPFLSGAITGIVTLLAFAMPPLVALRKVSPLRALRRDASVEMTGPVVSWVVGGAGMMLLTAWFTGDLTLTLAMFAGIGLMIFAVVLISLGLWRGSRWIGMQAGSVWRLATASLRRRGSANALQVVIFSITIMLFLNLLVVRTSLIREWIAQLPEGTPNYFLVNVYAEEVQRLEHWFASHDLTSAGLYPIVRARLTHIDGEMVTQRVSKDAVDTASIDRELNLTWADELPEDNALVAGTWWAPDTNDQVVSVESQLAERLKLSIGDVLRFQFAATTFEARVVSLRNVDWERMRPNFYMIFPRQALEKYPATFITSFYLPTSRRSELGGLIMAFPTITLLDIDAMMTQVRSIIAQVSFAVEVVLWLIMACGALVLAATVQSGMPDRYQEAGILRTLGASSRLVLGSICLEFLILGGVSGLLASAGAEVTTWLLQTRVFKLGYAPHFYVWLIGPVLGMCVISFIGVSISRAATRTPPIAILRAQE